MGIQKSILKPQDYTDFHEIIYCFFLLAQVSFLKKEKVFFITSRR